MYIHWGTRAVKDRLGYVADYCPVCRTLRAFTLQRHGEARHVQFISIPGEDSLVGYTRTCLSCGALFPAVPDSYKGLSPKLQELEPLRLQTFPHYHEEYAVQLALDRKTPSQLSAEDRRDRIHDPALAIAIAAIQRRTGMRMDRASWIAVAIFVALIFLPGTIANLFGANEDQLKTMSTSAMAIAFIVLFVTVGSSGDRIARKWALPHLANALAPLRPTDAELVEMIRGLKGRKLWLGSRLSVPQLQQAIEQRLHAV